MVLDRLGHRLSLLRWDARDLPERQQTLEAAIAWSYDLLSAREQALFRRMGVFVGGFTIEAAEEVMAALDGTKTDVLEALSALVDGSLVRVQPEPSGRYRYGMLESIREFALERLEENNELEAASRAHATYFIQVIEQDERQHHEGGEGTWLQLQYYDLQNLHAARQWLTRTPIPSWSYGLRRREASTGSWKETSRRGAPAWKERWIQRLRSQPKDQMPSLRRGSR